ILEEMTLLRNYDEVTGSLTCAGSNCDYPAVQTIKMSCVPWAKEGDKIKSGSVGVEYVGICEGHWKVHFATRAQWIPMRFVAGR
ncbi:hypothetical protein LCGC14_2831730, partial [marine sediment metagenome]